MLIPSFRFLCLALFIRIVQNHPQEEIESKIMDLLTPFKFQCTYDCDMHYVNFELIELSIGDNMCFKQCLLKEIGLWTKDGSYNRGRVNEHVLAYIEDEEEVVKVQSALDECFQGKDKVATEVEHMKEFKRINNMYECLKNYRSD